MNKNTQLNIENCQLIEKICNLTINNHNENVKNTIIFTFDKKSLFIMEEYKCYNICDDIYNNPKGVFPLACVVKINNVKHLYIIEYIGSTLNFTLYKIINNTQDSFECNFVNSFINSLFNVQLYKNKCVSFVKNLFIIYNYVLINKLLDTEKFNVKHGYYTEFHPNAENNIKKTILDVEGNYGEKLNDNAFNNYNVYAIELTNPIKLKIYANKFLTIYNEDDITFTLLDSNNKKFIIMCDRGSFKVEYMYADQTKCLYKLNLYNYLLTKIVDCTVIIEDMYECLIDVCTENTDEYEHFKEIMLQNNNEFPFVKAVNNAIIKLQKMKYKLLNPNEYLLYVIYKYNINEIKYKTINKILPSVKQLTKKVKDIIQNYLDKKIQKNIENDDKLYENFVEKLRVKSQKYETQSVKVNARKHDNMEIDNEQSKNRKISDDDLDM